MSLQFKKNESGKLQVLQTKDGVLYNIGSITKNEEFNGMNVEELEQIIKKLQHINYLKTWGDEIESKTEDTTRELATGSNGTGARGPRSRSGHECELPLPDRRSA